MNYVEYHEANLFAASIDEESTGEPIGIPRRTVNFITGRRSLAYSSSPEDPGSPTVITNGFDWMIGGEGDDNELMQDFLPYKLLSKILRSRSN